MADYIYLLENRLSGAQQRALMAVREVARGRGLTVFLVGGAVRDLTSGSPVRDLDVTVQGNALKLKKDLEKAGAVVVGEYDAGQALFVRFPGGVRMEVGSTLSVTYPKPGKPVAKPATILEDLRRRDFTANAMALSLNDGSYGLLMDPLNGVADIENRELRLVSNYGFIEDPVRMIRAARYAARLGWQMEEKTQARYETGKTEGYISAMQGFHRGYETEEIVHEEDPLRVLRRLEQEGWLKVLAPAWGSAKANVPELEKLREAQMQLQMQGIHSDPSAAQFPLLTAKMAAKDVADLKRSFPRAGFVEEIEALEGDAKKLAAELGQKQAGTASATWKMLTAAPPEVVLWVAYSTKSPTLQAKFKSFYTEWPQAKQKIPHVLLQEMRIVPELVGYGELIEKLFFELIDGKLGTVEEMKAFLEPYSPPAPPPPVNMRRARAPKKDAKAVKSRKKAEKSAAADAAVESGDETAGALPAEGAEEQAGSPTDEKVAQAKPDEVKPAAELTSPKKLTGEASSPTPGKSIPAKQATPTPPPPPPPAKKTAAVPAAAKTPAKQVAPAPAKKTVPAKMPEKAPAKKSVPAKVAKKAVVHSAPGKVAAKQSSKSLPVAAKSPVKMPQKVAAKSTAKVPAKGAKVSAKAPAKKR